MELGDLLRSALPGDPAVIRETAVAIETLIAQILEVRTGLERAAVGAERTDDPAIVAELSAQLDAEVMDARRQQRIVLAYADRLEARLARADRLGEPLNAEREGLPLLPLPIPDGDDAMPWWAWPRISTILQIGRGQDERAETADAAHMALIDAVYLAITAWRQTDGALLDDLVSSPIAAREPTSASTAAPSSATADELVRLARLPATGVTPSSSARGLVSQGVEVAMDEAPTGGAWAEVAGVLAGAERLMTLLVATPRGLALRQAWTSPGAAVLAVGDGTAGAAAMLEPDAVPAAFAELVGLDDASEGGRVESERREILLDRGAVESLLSPDAGTRARSIEALRSGPAGRAAADGSWRAWSAAVIRPHQGIIDGTAIIVVDTPAGSFLACPLAGWATLRPASAATVRAALHGLATW